MTRLSGWCSGPTHARPQCDRCRSASCECVGCVHIRSTAGVSALLSEVQAVADEMKRINDRYGERITADPESFGEATA